jgi:hypothetical protein
LPQLSGLSLKNQAGQTNEPEESLQRSLLVGSIGELFSRLDPTSRKSWPSSYALSYRETGRTSVFWQPLR